MKKLWREGEMGLVNRCGKRMEGEALFEDKFIGCHASIFILFFILGLGMHFNFEFLFLFI